MATDLPKISKNDPAWVALEKVTDVLEPFDRVSQLRILAATCVLIGEYDYANLFLKHLLIEARDR